MVFIPNLLFLHFLCIKNVLTQCTVTYHEKKAMRKGNIFIFCYKVFAWVAVFVLPLNAAVNPVLYTISTAPFLGPARRGLRTFKRSCKLSLTTDQRRTYSSTLGKIMEGPLHVLRCGLSAITCIGWEGCFFSHAFGVSHETKSYFHPYSWQNYLSYSYRNTEDWLQDYRT